MRRYLKDLLLITLCFLLCTGCTETKQPDNEEPENNTETVVIDDNKESVEVSDNMKITINDKEYSIKLEDNETVKALLDLLPLEFTMNELNGNEKYVYMDTSLPTDSYYPGHINAGDVMLFGSDCLVVFYKSFDTPYGYTRIGHIDDFPELGRNNVKARIEK